MGDVMGDLTKGAHAIDFLYPFAFRDLKYFQYDLIGTDIDGCVSFHSVSFPNKSSMSCRAALPEYPP